jgi:hypothetical protein
MMLLSFPILFVSMVTWKIMQGASPTKVFGESSRKILSKEVTVEPDGPRETATFAGGRQLSSSIVSMFQ